jgi:NAD+ kinase
MVDGLNKGVAAAHDDPHNRPQCPPETRAALCDIKSIGLLQHPKLVESQELCQKIAQRLRSWGFGVHIASAWDTEDRHWVAQVGLLITLGGDGTILRAARMAFRSGTPILGVNLGRLGFLSELTPTEWETKLASVLEGHYWLESRMMLSAECRRAPDRVDSYDALNDIVVSRGSVARSVRLATYIDQQFFTTYKADGVIVATPTGSTAYALAAGGPILPPQLRNLLLIPVAAHLSLDRAIVLPDTAAVEIQVSSDNRAILTVDGQFEVALQDGDTVTVSAGAGASHFVRTQDKGYFYRSLMERLR